MTQTNLAADAAISSSLRTLRVYHAKAFLYNTAKAKEYREAAGNDPAKWSRLIGNAEGFERDAAFHKDAIDTLSSFFPPDDVVSSEPEIADWKMKTPLSAKTKSRLSVYTFGFKGLALGGCAVVIASSPEEADQAFKSQGGTPLGTPHELICEPRPLIVPTVVHYDNGDY